MRAETWISIDTETSGPAPAVASLLSIGACLVDDPATGIEILVRPDPALQWDRRAERIHGLKREVLLRDGLAPADAARTLADWVEQVVPAGSRPVFVALNAPFDWMFVTDLVWRHLGRNPFGHSALDIKALYLGRHLGETGEWAETSRLAMLEHYPVDLPHTHNALDDAREQAWIVRRIVESARPAR